MQLQSAKTELEATYEQLKMQQMQLDMAMSQSGNMTEEDIDEAIEQIDLAVIEIDQALLRELPQAQQELEDAKDLLDEGQVELNKGQMQLTTELSSAAVQLSLAEQQLEQGEKQFEEARDAAFKQAGLDGALSTETLSAILSASNFSMPAGYLDENGQSTLVKVGDKFSSIDELENLLLMDIATAELGKSTCMTWRKSILPITAVPIIRASTAIPASSSA